MAVNLLLSYAFHARSDLAAIRRGLVCGRVMVDSGAFTAHTKGRRVDLAAYGDFLESWRGCWDHAVTLDVIGDPVATAANTRRLHARGIPVMPVFTKGGRLPEFDAMVRDVGYVCVGGLVGVGAAVQAKRVAMLQRRAAELGGGIHALGVGAMTALRAARPYSADASTPTLALQFGGIAYFNGQRIVATAVSNRARLARDRVIIRDHGVDLGGIASARRLPSLVGRGPLLRAMSLAYAAADEQLIDTHPVPAPSTVNDTAGTHLYHSTVTDTYAGWIAQVDRELHSGRPAPGVWRRYGIRHPSRCRAKETHAPTG